ncbi:MAG TPA: histidine kinase [Puia sp.]|jgi:ligand-binding sensor domain-containing protein/two-component sensor histidine kinase
MMRCLLLTCSIIFFFSYSCFSQEYSYTHYDIGDGLAGSTVYCITQDKDGFIWMGTETGVSRFDGTHFRNFTTSDGLRDIEILQMFGDSKGRVWMAPFRNSVCYYYKGRIFTQDNDSLLSRIHLRENIEHFAEDAQGNILLQEKTALYWITPKGTLRRYDSIGKEAIRGSVSVCRSLSGHFQVEFDGRIVDLSDKGFSPLLTIVFPQVHQNFIDMSPSWAVWKETPLKNIIRSFITHKTIVRQIDYYRFRHISFSLIDDSLLFDNETLGTTEYNLHTGRTQKFLPGKDVSRVFRDMSGNLWFSTLGYGIFRLNSDEFRTIKLPTPIAPITAVCSIRRLDDELLVGNNHNYLFRLSLPELSVRSRRALKLDSKNQILYVDTLDKDKIIFGSDYGMSLCNRNFVFSGKMSMGVKAVFEKNNKELLIGTSWGAAFFDKFSFRVTDTLLRQRTTSVYWRNDTSYIGTLNGLYFVTANKPIFFPGKKVPFLRKRISAITGSPDGILWIASYDGGIIGYKGDSIVAAITKKQGLTSDICRNLSIHDNILWVGTDKGLNKVELNKPGYPVTRYTSNDGLGSDIINIVYADSSTVYVGTPVGLSYFDESKADVSEQCLLHLLAVINGGVDKITDTSHLRLSWKESGIRLEFAGISYRSVGNITYRYRLLGLDSGWKDTKETYLEYPTLPSGNYIFELQAINKFGIQSRLISLRFTVTTPFWHTVWFYSLLVAAFLSLTWLVVSLRIRSIHRRQGEKEQLTQRMAELEHKALQSQMNPHFIFNCLNSIQQYIFIQDVFAANKYLTGFARLIRATLHNSTQAFIPLADEIGYLSDYLSLEKLRFKDKMDYTIRADPGMDMDALLIPPMLLQPFVENSMRHGLRHKTTGKGSIRIDMQQTAEGLIVTIEDNGIGRQQAARYKTSEHIEYQSRGMSMTADRIRIMNSIYGGNIRTEITDLGDEQGQPSGTRVVLHFPLFHDLIQKNTP